MKMPFYKAGDKVEIFNTKLNGEIIGEGIAQLKRFKGKEDYPPYRETWLVRFPGEAETFTRTLVPGENHLHNS
jgi:hypothetical protein